MWAYNVVNYYDADVFVDIDFFFHVEILNTVQGSESPCMISHNDIHFQEPELEYVRKELVNVQFYNTQLFSIADVRLEMWNEFFKRNDENILLVP